MKVTVRGGLASSPFMLHDYDASVQALCPYRPHLVELHACPASMLLLLTRSDWHLQLICESQETHFPTLSQYKDRPRL
eukprot:1159197-Pelagomonas_calceolata.AAC.5